MKAQLTDKGEGWICIKIEAGTATEAMILSTVGNGVVDEISATLNTGTEGYGTARKPYSRVAIGSFNIDTHDIVS